MPTVLITGANRGLGFEFARQYAGDGWTVIACCRDPGKAEALQKLAKESKSVGIETLDISDANSIRLLAQRLNATAIDVLINNAGILSVGRAGTTATDSDPSQTFGTLDPEAWIKVFAVNTIAPMLMTQAFAANVARSEQKKIVCISSRMGSIASMEGGHAHVAYRTSKAALNAAVRATASQLAARGIISVSFTPGWVRTDMGGDSAALSPEESIAGMRKVIAGLTQKDSGQFLNHIGQVTPW